ncbi:hypothetical protein MNBD_NITROSPIRAE03-1748 [hydrothermal vent metagenome]|uniref:Uncharacterized protein n=1 Tax=hydrothermal vent metagenome TaxID=652676 RepID=A0A3B1DDZ8_9ZZZZ
MSNEKGPDTEKTERGKDTHTFLKVIDTLAKVAAAAAIVGAALIANTYQSRMTAITILTQREQAESELRATMFSNLIGPIAGLRRSDSEIPARREKLLVELLALNFNEHFEFKPLLEFVDKRLAGEGAEEERRSLKSIARRVIDRQIASLLKEGSLEDRTKVSRLFFTDPPRTEEQKSYFENLPEKSRGKYLGTFFNRKSPDGNWILNLTATDPDAENKKVKILINLKSNIYDPDSGYEDIPMAFTLTPFDFPLTDNTLLADGNRFAVVLDNISADGKTGTRTVLLRLIWFPKNYFTPRKRPVNYSEFRKNSASR